MSHCNNICKQYTVNRDNKNPRKYTAGQKRCHQCEIFIDWSGIYCPCCNNKLRTKPRTSRNRKVYQEIMLVKRI